MRLMVGLVALACGYASPPQPKKAAPPPPSAAAAATKKSAIDKKTFESYVRHLFVWGPSIQIVIDDPKPAPMAGFLEISVRASAGPARQDEVFYVSKDGQKILRGVVYDVNQNPFKPDLDKLKTEFSASMGTPGAAVVLVVFSDFQCPYCKEEAKMLRQNLLAAYPKQVRLYFKDFPLDQIHPWARPASIAGRCVFRQNAASFWEYHDWMFENQATINAENLKAKVQEFAKGREIDALQLERCLDAKSTESEVNATIEQAKALRVMATPTLFINGRRVPAQMSWNDLRQVIDYEIEYQKTAKNAGEDCGCDVKLPGPGLNP